MSNGDGLPKGWMRASLGELGDFINGDRGKNYPSASAFVSVGVPFINAGHLENGLIDLSGMNYIAEDRFNLLGSGKVQPSDILYCLRGSLGKAALVTSIEKGAIASSLVIIRPLDNGNPKYLYYFLVSPLGKDEIARYDNGTAQPNLSARNVKAYSVPLAPLSEQRRIVAKIEELFSDLDAGIAALERAKAKLKRYRAAVLKAAVEGKLTEDWRAKHPPKETASQLLERILKERRRKWEEDQLTAYAKAGKKPPANWKEKYKEPAGPDESTLPALPEGWSWATADQLCEIGTGTTPSRRNPRFYDGGSIPWVMSMAVNHPFVDQGTEFVTQAAVDATTLQLYPTGTLLVALYGEGKTRGMVTELRIAATINQALGALVFQGAGTHVRSFVKVFLASHYVELRRQAAGGMQPNLNLGLVKRIHIPLPPLDEQSQIVCEISKRLSQMEISEDLLAANLKRSSRLRQSILKRAFEGKLVPQDPNDEPAGVLLERPRTKYA
jgi:type I restriction enzyme, S subunit